MLQKLKNKVRELGQKWKSTELYSRFTIILCVIQIIVIIWIMPPGFSGYLQEENYTAMEQVVYTIIEEQDTEVEFDTSKIDKYEVTHKEDGCKEIFIQGNTLEEIHLTVDKDYQIQKLTKGGWFNLILLAALYYIIVYGLGYIITVILFLINRTIKKIVKFFKT